MQNRFFERAFTRIVVQWGTRLAQEKGQGIPPFEQVVNRLAQGRIRLDHFLVELTLQPLFQVVHRRLAVRLMIG
jgi:hypothetical protein